tara:strand:+ start:1704 stop:2252 length:549 start_codon:yes stop_codon:yes gene_type:complete
MSELTITTAGVAQTQLRPGMGSNNERLNQMKTKVFDITPTTTTAECVVGDVVFQADELANFMSEKGGTAIIQSITILDVDDEGTSLDIVFMDTDGILDATVAGGTAIDAADGVIANSVLGFTNVSNYFDGIAWKVGQKDNIGLVIKSVSTSRSIWISAVNRGSTTTWTDAADLKLKIGYIQD